MCCHTGFEGKRKYNMHKEISNQFFSRVVCKFKKKKNVYIRLDKRKKKY